MQLIEIARMHDLVLLDSSAFTLCRTSLLKEICWKHGRFFVDMDALKERMSLAMQNIEELDSVKNAYVLKEVVKEKERYARTLRRAIDSYKREVLEKRRHMQSVKANSVEDERLEAFEKYTRQI